MNKKLAVTFGAYRDMQIIYDYIADDNPSAAKKMVDKIEKTYQKITEFPKIGRIYENFIYENTRFYVVKKKYLIVYTLQDETVYILRVLSSYQDICSKL